MGIIKQGILGGFSGRVAGVVGSSWKGIAVIKARPLSVANPKTAAQVAQRTKFGNTSDFASKILADIIKPLWDRFAQQMSGYNAFVKTNIDLFAAALPSTFADLVISSGKMATTAIATVSASNGDDYADVTWTDDSGEGLKLATDLCYLVCVNETTGAVDSTATADTRADESSTVDLAAALATSDSLHLYMAFKRADGTVVSDTSYKADTV